MSTGDVAIVETCTVLIEVWTYFTLHNQVSIFNSPYHCLCADINQPSETTPNQSSVSKIQTVAKHCPIYCQEQKFPESIH